ncbi:oligopeptide/dipeptide ABC transporter ATP-binding protein [Treponema sp.]|uniref:oligopeptide/dipeptide ABC transporter ATP-binding protein n=1 Tax=Treponema sp. TaxID=166 RepID=UPI003F09CC36
MEKDIILKAENIQKHFGLDAGFFAKKDKLVYAVNGVSLEIERGKTYGLVGESGCGKTTTARLLVGMYKADSGSIQFRGRNSQSPVEACALKKKELAAYREKVKYIFQDPSRSLNPRMTISTILTSPLKYSSLWQGKEHARQKAAELFEEIGLDKSDLDRRPQEFSGGQRQRISIARGLILEPELLICDEIVSALDVSVQAQILNLLQNLRKKRGLSFLFIAHDLKVSCYFCDTIGVMYRGMIVEESEAKNLYRDALHPYTQTLFAGGNFHIEKSGEMKTLLEHPSSCPFAHRCPKAREKCLCEIPPLEHISENHKVRCFFPNETQDKPKV